MAELTNNPKAGSGRAGRLKQLPRVDLTAMVDLAFLLITFFMLTTTLTKPQLLEVAMPVDAPIPLGVSEERTMTICLGSDNKLLWYKGALEKPLIKPVIDNYQRSGIQKTLFEQVKEIKTISGKDLIVLIKPSDKSNYKNLVDILDEMKITHVASYAIVDITKEELDIMKEKGIY